MQKKFILGPHFIVNKDDRDCIYLEIIATSFSNVIGKVEVKVDGLHITITYKCQEYVCVS
jgi:hypothetical protein